MVRTLLLLVVLSLGAPARAADPCPDLWFARNAILHIGGYCVPTPLGEAVFANAGCSSEEPELPDFLRAQLDRIAELEAAYACVVDTEASEIDLWQLEKRRELTIQPINVDTERLCVMKAPTSLRAAPSLEAEVLGWLERGDLVLMQHEDAGGADFASRVKRGALITDEIGWFSSSQCKAL